MKQSANINYIKRTKRTENFTVLNNEILQNKKLSFGAKGLLVYILSLPDDWIMHKSWLQKEFKVSRRFIDVSFKEIEEAGYMCSVEMNREKGRFPVKNYFFYDECMKPNKTNQLNHCTESDNGYPTTVNEQLQRTNTDKELTLPNNHTPSLEVSNVSASRQSSTKLQDPTLKRLAKISGTVAERYRAFEKRVREQGKRDQIDEDVIEDVINTYGADDAEYPNYMRFETYRYFDCQLMLRKFDTHKRN